MNDGSTDLNKFNDIKHFSVFTVRLNIRLINDLRTAIKPLELSGDIVFDIEYSIGRQTGSLKRPCTV